MEWYGNMGRSTGGGGGGGLGGLTPSSHPRPPYAAKWKCDIKAGGGGDAGEEDY